jgi:hypothetical protein
MPEGHCPLRTRIKLKIAAQCSNKFFGLLSLLGRTIQLNPTRSRRLRRPLKLFMLFHPIPPYSTLFHPIPPHSTSFYPITSVSYSSLSFVLLSFVLSPCFNRSHPIRAIPPNSSDPRRSRSLLRPGLFRTIFSVLY